jgi:glucose-6-phosphate 1-dehydrogenase
MRFMDLYGNEIDGKSNGVFYGIGSTKKDMEPDRVQAWVIVRFDSYGRSELAKALSGTEDPFEQISLAFTFKKVVASFEFAQQEVKRLNELGEGKDILYFAMPTRIFNEELIKLLAESNLAAKESE